MWKEGLTNYGPLQKTEVTRLPFAIAGDWHGAVKSCERAG